MNWKIIISILIMLLGVPANAWFWDKTLVDYKNDFKDKVFELKDQKKETTIELTETKKLIFNYATLLQNAKKDDVDFDNLHEHWQDTENEIELLNSKFKNLVESADAYFNETKKKTDEISDAKMKQSAMNNILEKENKYIDRLKNTNKGLLKLSIGHRKLKDIIIFLEISNSLKSLDKELNIRFSEIDKIINNVMNDLELLNKESKELLNDEF